MHASGRRAWHELPRPLVEEAERRLGSAVRGFEERRGGFSYGVLGVATLDGGERVFVKAVPADSGHAADYRSEAIVAAALPAGVPAPRFVSPARPAGGCCSAPTSRPAGSRTPPT
ncbi:hypothetical protein [Nonomuraea aurantiaca]|uniref:hypothetical protein n=1 Tax=Nonomuraea aurantiaca TaxID=2878562 RepID=UPI001CD9B11C|nr:hypothetical protein [Nonomuraea aurantiaca]MCA2221776.1 hypothetical protein [Nonomuraea aurantiaca]